MWLCTLHVHIYVYQVYTPQKNKVKCVHNIQMPQLVINCNNIIKTNQTFFLRDKIRKCILKIKERERERENGKLTIR